MADPAIKPIAELRKDLDLTQEAFGALLGLKSKGQVSEIEKTSKCSAEIALRIEKLSEGRIDAGSLNPAVAAVRREMAA